MSRASRESPGMSWCWTRTVLAATSVSVLIWFFINWRTQGAIVRRTARVKMGPSKGSNQVVRGLENHGTETCGEYLSWSYFLRFFRVLTF